jgi:hypothetical protein
MKKRGFVFVGMLTIILIFGLVLSGCETGSGGGGDDEPETSKTTHYPQIEMRGDIFDDGAGSEWRSYFGDGSEIRLTDVVPGGVAKPLTQYIVTVAGTTSTPINDFCVDWFANGDNWIDSKDIGGTNAQKSVSGTFTYQGLIQTRGDFNASDAARGNFRILNRNNPAVTDRWEVEATLANVTITIEEVAEGTVILVGNKWTDDSVDRREWTSEKAVKLSDVLPQGAVKASTQYIITLKGSTDKAINNFRLHIFAQDDDGDNWKDITDGTAPKNVSGAFTYKTVLTTRADYSNSDFNRSYLRLMNVNNPPVTYKGEIEATLTNVTITIEEVAEDTVILVQNDDNWQGSVNFTAYSIPKIEAEKSYTVTVSGNLDKKIDKFQILVKDENGTTISTRSGYQAKGPGSFNYQAELTAAANSTGATANFLIIRNGETSPTSALANSDIAATITGLEVTVVEVTE